MRERTLGYQTCPLPRRMGGISFSWSIRQMGSENFGFALSIRPTLIHFREQKRATQSRFNERCQRLRDFLRDDASRRLIVGQKDTQLFLNHLRECRSSDSPVVTELNLTGADGGKIPVLLSSTATLSLMKDGARLYQTAIFDLTERKRAEKALRENQQRLQATYERALIGISEASPEGNYVGANEEFCRILGYTKDEILQSGIKDVTHKEDYSREINLYRQLIAGEIPFYRMEKRYVCKDGAIIWTELLRSIVRDSEGVPLYTIGAERESNPFLK